MLSIKIRRKRVNFRMLCVTLTAVEWWPALPVMGQIINILDWCATLLLSQLLILTVAEQNLLQTMQKQMVCLPCSKPVFGSAQRESVATRCLGSYSTGTPRMGILSLASLSFVNIFGHL